MAITRIKKEEREHYREIIWEEYAKQLPLGTAPNQTRRFFSTIPNPLQTHFSSSTQRILQLGVSSGTFLSDSGLAKQRECIGYDHSRAGVAKASSSGITVKLIDLSDINESGNLSYLDVLTADLATPADILAIRIFEYLEPQAVILLIFTLINNAKPGSIFYLETYSSITSALPEAVCHQIESGYIASFFGPRTDIKFQHHTITPEIVDTQSGHHEGEQDRLIVAKL